MRPIPSPISKDAINLLQKAQRLLEKAEKLEMVEHEGKKVPAFAADGKGAKDMKEKGEGHEQKIISCLKKKGGAASLEECAKECGVSKAECKKIIDKMDNVKMSPHGDVILMDGLQKGSEMCPECGKEKNKMGCMKMGCKMDVEKSEAGAQPGFETSYDSNPSGVMFMAESGGQTRSAYYTTNQYLYGGDDVANKGSTSESVSFDKLSGQLNPHDGNGVDRQVVDGILSKMRDMMGQ
tara:strand:- start:359 stop:1069 length:711 start_codon:yes stop_codon:yes gene_type:complete